MDQPPNKQKNIEKEKISSSEEMRQVFEQSREGKVEKSEISKAELEAIKKELEREIDLINADENLRKEAESKAQKIGSLDEEEKIKHLLEIAKQKGIIFALKVAKSMNDPYILDTFHDLLVREGLYKNYKI